MPNVQIFGIKNSNTTRGAERFFKERRIALQFIDLKQRPMAGAEIKRFIDRFGWDKLLDTESSQYLEGGLKYLKLSDADLLTRIEREPRLLRLPFVRSGSHLSIGADENAWRNMIAAETVIQKR